MGQQYKATGRIKLIEETQTFPSGFTKREFVITTDDEYPKDIKFEVKEDKCDWLENFNLGDKVDVFFNIYANEYNGKYYNNTVAWKFRKVKETQEQPAQPAQPAPAQSAIIQEEEDIPF